MNPEILQDPVHGHVRLQVYLARCGIASRRKCEEYIASGRVKVNNIVVSQPGFKVSAEDEVHFDGRVVTPEQEKRYIALHKPPGYLCSQFDEQGRKLAVDLLKPYFRERLYNVGRLDYLSEGLIFFSNDGVFTSIVSHPSSEIEKEYRLDLIDRLQEEILVSFQRGIVIEGETYRIEKYEIEHPKRVRIVLIEGKNREIRRLMEHAQIRIRSLTRLRIGPVKLGDIPKGGYRHLTKEEIKWFYERKNT